jgi:hypothetical protein
MKMTLRPLHASLALAALALLLASCATSSGYTYSRAAASESGAARQGRQDEPASPPSRPPERSASEPSGHVSLVIESEPRYEPKGTLVLEGLGGGSSVYVDGGFRLGSSIELPVGPHDVRVARFGYEDFEASVFILVGQRTRLSVDQAPAVFSIAGMRAESPSFDPRDPGHLGTCRIWIEATSAGEGSVAVLDASGREVRSLGRADYHSRRALFLWDGRDGSGRILEPGTYEVVAEGRGRQGEDRASTEVEIARGRFSRSALLHGGVSGALFAPDARCLELGDFEATAGAVFHLEPEGSSMSGMGTIESALRAGLSRGPAAFELDLSVMGVVWPADPLADSLSVSAALKGAIASEDGSRAAGLYLRATGALFTAPGSGDARPSWDGAARYPGLAVGAPLELAFERSRIFIAPEVEISDYYPYWYGSSLPWSPPGLFAWGYLRVGIEASVGRNITIGFSSALRTEPFGAGLGVRWPLPLGIEAKWYAPSLPVTLSFAATGEIDGMEAFYFGAGLFAAYRF